MDRVNNQLVIVNSSRWATGIFHFKVTDMEGLPAKIAYESPQTGENLKKYQWLCYAVGEFIYLPGVNWIHLEGKVTTKN